MGKYLTKGLYDAWLAELPAAVKEVLDPPPYEELEWDAPGTIAMETLARVNSEAILSTVKKMAEERYGGRKPS